MKTDPEGGIPATPEDVESRVEKYGTNTFPEKPSKPFWVSIRLVDAHAFASRTLMNVNRITERIWLRSGSTGRGWINQEIGGQGLGREAVSTNAPGEENEGSEKSQVLGESEEQK